MGVIRYICRKRHAKEVIRIRTAKMRHIYERASLVIQKNYRMHMARRRFVQTRQRVIRVQAYVRMRQQRRVYLTFKRRLVGIQRVAKAYVYTRLQKQLRLAELESRVQLAQQQVREENLLFGESILLYPLQQKLVFVSQNETSQFQKDILTERLFDQLHASILSNKVYLFNYVLDLELMADPSDIYAGSWAAPYKQVFDLTYSQVNYVQQLHCGTSHTIAVTPSGTLYSWGENDYGQLGGSEQHMFYAGQSRVLAQKMFQSCVRQVSVKGDCNMLLDAQGDVYVWGDNSKHRLGVGSQDEADVVRQPVQLVSNRKFSFVRAGGFRNYALTAEGELLSWPTYVAERKAFTPAPTRQSFQGQKIRHVSCGDNFTLLLAESGVVFSEGQNQFGQLGLGDFGEHGEFQAIPGLAALNDKVVQVECGKWHALCLTKLQRVYCWGNGLLGQLGNGTLRNQHSPCLLAQFNPQKSKKILQVAAGAFSSFILLENGALHFSGRLARNQKRAAFDEFPLKSKVPPFPARAARPLSIATHTAQPLRIATHTARPLRIATHTAQPLSIATHTAQPPCPAQLNLLAARPSSARR